MEEDRFRAESEQKQKSTERESQKREVEKSEPAERETPKWEPQKRESRLWVNGGSPYFISGDEVPERFADTYCTVNRAVRLPEEAFPLRARVLAALHLAEIMAEWKERVDGALHCLTPEALFVNPGNGEIRIRIEEWQQCGLEYGFPGDVSTEEKGRRDCFLRYQAKPDGEGLTESDLSRFAAYVTFRMLCVEDPFDGQDTLIRYPYLSKEAIEEIHHTEAVFIFSDSSNRFSEYIGRTAAENWGALPIFVKRSFQRALGTKDTAYEKQADWLTQMRKLRDCLVYVNGQFRLCDPEEPNRVLFLEAGDFKIPVWARKAVYWYHVGGEFDEQTKGIVGGIMQENFLENRSRGEWIVEAGRRKLLIHPGESIRVEAGMKIAVEDTLISVTDGGMA